MKIVEVHYLDESFNSPLGILFVRTTMTFEQIVGLIFGFNSPLGILFVRTSGLCRLRRHVTQCFNSPLGILFVRTCSSSGGPTCK